MNKHDFPILNQEIVGKKSCNQVNPNIFFNVDSTADNCSAVTLPSLPWIKDLCTVMSFFSLSTESLCNPVAGKALSGMSNCPFTAELVMKDSNKSPSVSSGISTSAGLSFSADKSVKGYFTRTMSPLFIHNFFLMSAFVYISGSSLRKSKDGFDIASLFQSSLSRCISISSPSSTPLTGSRGLNTPSWNFAFIDMVDTMDLCVFKGFYEVRVMIK